MSSPMSASATREHGGTAVEYRLLAGLITAVIMGGVMARGQQVDVLFGRISPHRYRPTRSRAFTH